METIQDRTMRQATYTATTYFQQAITDLDQIFNEPGYAKKHPELVAAYVKACSDDYHASLNYEGLKDISQSLTAISESIDELKSNHS